MAAVDASRDAANTLVRWTSLQFRRLPSFAEPWSRTFFEAHGVDAVEVSSDGSAWALFRPPATQFSAYEIRKASLSAESIAELDARMHDILRLPSAIATYTCRPCDSECESQTLSIVTDGAVSDFVGLESLSGDCDPDVGTVPGPVAALARELVSIITAISANRLESTASNPPPRVRLGVAEPIEVDIVDSADLLERSAEWPFEPGRLVDIAGGPRVRNWWWETTLDGDETPTLWTWCSEQMLAGIEGHPGPFLAHDGGRVFAVACVPGLPGGADHTE